jgi:prephenate dehydrogenase
LLTALDAFNRDLGELAEAIRQGDGERVLNVFRHAKKSRDNLYRD